MILRCLIKKIIFVFVSDSQKSIICMHALNAKTCIPLEPYIFAELFNDFFPGLKVCENLELG